MFLIWVQNDIRRIFSIKNRIQLAKMFRLSTHSCIFEEKQSILFLEEAQKSFFQFIMFNFPENSFLRLEWTRNDFWWCIEHLKFSFWGLYRPSKNSHVHYWVYLIKTLHLNTHMTIYGVVIFLIKKVAKLVQTQKFCHQRLNERLYVTRKNWKNESHYVAHKIKTKCRKMSLLFLENSKNYQNRDLFEGAVMGRRIYPTRWSQFFPKTTPREDFDWSTLMTPTGPTVWKFPPVIWYVKRPQLSIRKN